MADNKDQPMNGEDFSQDVKDGEDDVPMNGEEQQHTSANGGNAPARDDDR